MSIRFFRNILLIFIVSTTLFGSAAIRASVPSSIYAQKPIDTLHNEGSISDNNRRLYDSIEAKSNRRRLSRIIHNALFRSTPSGEDLKGRVVDEGSIYKQYEGKRIGNIVIKRSDVFNENSKYWYERVANSAHIVTRERIIRRDLLFKEGDEISPEIIVKNEQLLASRSYMSYVNIALVCDPIDTNLVSVIVSTRDSWTITVDAALRSDGMTMTGLIDKNIFGSGNSLTAINNFSRTDFSYGGFGVEYQTPNLWGTFFTAEAAIIKDFYNRTLSVSFNKSFIKPTDYEAGASYSDIRSKNYMIEQDTSLLVSGQEFDAWGGYSHFLPKINSSIFTTAHYNKRNFDERPEVGPSHNPSLHNQESILFNAGLYREKFYTTNMIYGFGIREYVATGYKAELISGYSWGEFGDAWYLGARYQTGAFTPKGYFTGEFSLGSYIDHRSGMWYSSAVNVKGGWFSNLVAMNRWHLRQFVSLGYTHGWNRGTGNLESIRFTEENGLQAFSEWVIGKTRLVLNTETVLFTPLQPLGFKITLFAFGDFGVIGESPNTFKNSPYTTFGLGLRLRNEQLVFSTIQLRFGLAFGREGMVDSEMFSVSNSTHLQSTSYRPTRADIIEYK